MYIKPVVKWAGGKRKFAERICSYIDYNETATYFEPFLGGGAILLTLLPKNAICFDKNEELVNMYNIIKTNPSELIERLYGYYVVNHSTNFYYYVRNLDRKCTFKNSDKIDRAARFLYLNKTCYNGLWRVNLANQNNVPIGKYKNVSFTAKENILELSKYLNDNNVIIKCDDYSKVLEFVKKDDIIYFDPPYDIDTEENTFSTYTKEGFNQKNQKELRDLSLKLISIGAKVLISNSNTKYINELYSGKEFKILKDLTYVRTVGSNSAFRKRVNDVLIIGSENN